MQTFDKNERITVAAYLNEYKGTEYLHIREHYTDKAGELKPTKKGIAIDFELAAELLACLTAVIGEAKNAPQVKAAKPAKATKAPAKAKAAAIPPKS
jgi:gamma-glutamylcysteine synthetase